MCVCWRHFYIQLTCGNTEMGEKGQSIIIRREKKRWQRKKATVLSQRCRDNKIRTCVIHLWPWHSAPHPPTTISVGWCAEPWFLVFLWLFYLKLLFYNLRIKNSDTIVSYRQSKRSFSFISGHLYYVLRHVDFTNYTRYVHLWKST